MRNPPRNNPPYESPTGRHSALRFFFCPVFRAIPLRSCHCFTGHTPPTSSPDTRPVFRRLTPIRHIILSLHPSPVRFCFWAHLHPVPRPLHSSSSHPSDAHCPPVPLTQACASAAGLPIRRTASPHFLFALPPRAHLHVQRLPHSPPVHRARPVRSVPAPGIPSHSHHSYCLRPASANPRTHKKTADVLDIRCFSVVIQIRIRRAASRIQSGRT